MDFSSKNYWEDRYVSGNNSGAGSYGRLAEYKATFLNNFVKKNQIKKIIEFGSGDGNQLGLADYPHYLGLDVSKESIRVCNKMFEDKPTYGFAYYDPELFQNVGAVLACDLSMSLDVIFHLVEDEVYEKYLNDLFSVSRKYVIIYSSNESGKQPAEHVKHRKFTKDVASMFEEWELVQHEDNPHPFEPADPINTSFASFYIYKKRP